MARHPDLDAGERTMLEQFLDQRRELVVERLDGIDDATAHTRLLPATDLTIGGLVKHLAHVEDMWFTARLAGTGFPEPWASAPFGEDPDWDFHSAADDPVRDLRALYDASCDRSRAVTASFESLDALAAVPSFGKGPVSVRWVLVHVIEETAHHLGHLDLLRDVAVGRAADRNG